MIFYYINLNIKAIMQIEKRVEQRNKYVETIFIGSNGSLNSLILDNYNNNINKKIIIKYCKTILCII